MKLIEVKQAKEFASTLLADPILKMAVYAVLDKAPEFDLVRCKDCKHAGINENHPKKPLLCYLTRMCGTVDPEWYCWQGERKGE